MAVRTLRGAKLEGGKEVNLRQRFVSVWKKYGGNRYLGIASAATLVAIVLVFLLGLTFFTIRDAALAGFVAWESLINKLLGGSTAMTLPNHDMTK